MSNLFLVTSDNKSTVRLFLAIRGSCATDRSSFRIVRNPQTIQRRNTCRFLMIRNRHGAFSSLNVFHGHNVTFTPIAMTLRSGRRPTNIQRNVGWLPGTS